MIGRIEITPRSTNRKFQIIYEDATIASTTIRVRIFDDVQFKDQYIIATTDDALSETLYIPYYRIYNMKLIKTEE
jgi:hypothetical protein